VLVLLFLAVLGSAQAQLLDVCLEDRVGLNSATKTAFAEELSILLEKTEWRLNCHPSAVRLAVRFSPPLRYASALGLAYRTGERIAPRLEVYLNTVLRSLNEVRAPSVVGRALARVAAHELVHFTFQRTDHDASGLLAERFPATQLAGADSRPFLLARKSAPR